MIRLEFESKAENEAMARIVIASYLLRMNPTMEEMADVKTAVSEAVTNAIIHGYEEKEGIVLMEAKQEEDCLYVRITDRGVGIEDIEQAMEPMYTTKPDCERVGMGFAFMEAFMDEVKVESEVGKGTRISMKKRVNQWNKEN